MLNFSGEAVATPTTGRSEEKEALEDNAVAVYGRSYISIVPTAGSITAAAKEQIITDLKNTYTIASVTPVIVDPVTTFIRLGVNFKYNKKSTTKTSETLVSNVRTALQNYDTNNLQKFDSVFRHSNLLRALDDSDQSVLSSTVAVKLKRNITPTLNAATKYTIKFNNAAYHPTAAHSQTVVESSGFYLSGNTNLQYIDDDGSGNIRTFYLLGGTTKTITNANAGTVNYNTGEVVLTSFNFTPLKIHFF